MNKTILELTENELEILTALAMNAILKNEKSSKLVKEEIGEKTMTLYGIYSLSSLMKYASMEDGKQEEIIVNVVKKLFSELGIND